jgi:hypothetical protein
VRGWETPTLLGPLERANLNHKPVNEVTGRWTKSKNSIVYRERCFHVPYIYNIHVTVAFEESYGVTVFSKHVLDVQVSGVT